MKHSTRNKESLLQEHPEVRSQEISENAAIFSTAVIVCTGSDFLSGFHEDILRKSWGQSPLSENEHSRCLVDVSNEVLSVCAETHSRNVAENPSIFLSLILLFEFERPQNTLKVYNAGNRTELLGLFFNSLSGIPDYIC